MSGVARFIVFMAVAFLLFVRVLLFTVRGRREKPKVGTLMTLGAIVVILGMLFARYSALYRIPWEIYYGFPFLATLLLPPLWLRMSRAEIGHYLPLLGFMTAVC